MAIDQQWKARFDAKWQEDANGCWMWSGARLPHKRHGGYGVIKIPRTRKQIMAHRLSYLIHRGPIPPGKCVLHRCDVPLCVNPAHLFVGTKLDNALDMAKKLRHLYGERNPRSKLTETQVMDIHRLMKLGVTQKKISEMFRVGQMQISRIKRGERWRHVFEKI